ncbi:unnamed protein product [Fusarium venenatum]|uniref:Prion-inhibition and propagation HeLo domain-containing protein n=1 Tax=Fusarium venenatum TaxID=56646 RepID=A0A2L2TQG8_9HYPO|nr:uncharacterized protein FVRRES_10940 [Fusarium venenatum]CEI70863.1 unnamed protein product [Fusarium venenatum]
MATTAAPLFRNTSPITPIAIFKTWKTKGNANNLNNVMENRSCILLTSNHDLARGYVGESHLLKLWTECESIETEFKTVLNRIDNRKRRTIGKDDERAKNKIPHLALAGLWDRRKIDEMDSRLKALQKQIMNCIVFCLWADSKKTARWELHLTKRLDTILGILARVEKSAAEQGGTIRDMTDDKPFEPLISEMDDVCQALISEGGNSKWLTRGVDGKLTEVISSLIKACQSMSLQRVGQEVTKALTSSNSADAKNIRSELVRLLWDKRWTLDNSMAMFETDQVLGKPELADVGKDISHGLYFESMYDVEDAVANNFDTTYEWIFQHEPKNSNGKALWLRTFLQPWAKSLPILITNYYAWNSGLNMQKAWEGLKKTTLRGKADFPDWEEWEINESFQALMNECGKLMAMALFADGLDEFEIPPATVVSYIRSMANDAAQGINICIASRPWTEFEHASNDGPMLQMHLLTEDDMMTFVTKSFQKNRGYIGLKSVYPHEVAKLTDDVVQKADGVFLWVSFVVMELIDLFTAGDSMAQLQETVEKLPTNLSSLFDAIWARIPHRHLPDACAMIRLARSACGPLPWLLMWLADESRSTKVDPSAMSLEAKYHAKRGLKRRLATRTRGILELSGAAQEVVNFAHRTTRDWVKQAHIWEELCASCPRNFEPHLGFAAGRNPADV